MPADKTSTTYNVFIIPCQAPVKNPPQVSHIKTWIAVASALHERVGASLCVRNHCQTPGAIARLHGRDEFETLGVQDIGERCVPSLYHLLSHMCHSYDTLHQPLRQSDDIDPSLDCCAEATSEAEPTPGAAPLGS